MVPEIWSMMSVMSVTDRIFCHFETFFFFYPPNNPKNQNFKILKKTPWDFIIFTSVPKTIFTCYTGSLDMVRNRFNYFSFWVIFLPFSLPNSPKNQNLKKNEKKCLEISLLYICVPKIMIRWYKIPEIWCTMDGRTEKVTYRGGCPT